ncbi:MAG: PAS domain-containing protein [Cyclobacteriaceae bacterium]|nr:PAS domain-containing protein [Cyclobacteriaceae bacterium]
MKAKSKQLVHHPLLCWDIVTMQQAARLRKKEFDPLFQLKAEYDWGIDLNALLQQPFDAIVLTDVQQTILWVSNGFKAMTGYDPKFAIGKRPEFLQGNETSAVIKKQIREKILQHEPVSGSLANYKKNGKPYLCRLQIFPLLNQHKQLKHFIALEQEIKHLHYERSHRKINHPYF